MRKKNNSRSTLLDRYQQLINISCDLASELDLNILLSKIVDAACRVSDAQEASILMYDPNKNTLYFQAATNLDSQLKRGLAVPIEKSIAGWIVTNQKPVIVDNPQKDKRHFEYYGLSNRFEDILAIPQTKWAYISKSILNIAFQRKRRVVDTTKLKIIDRVQINLISCLIAKDLSDGAIEMLYMKAGRNKSERYRAKKLFEKIISVVNHNDNDVKEGIAIVERISKFDKIIGLT